MTQTKSRLYTPEEYLELEANAEYKSEYRDGAIVPMAGGTTNHNELTLNLAVALKLALKGQAYKIYLGDVRLWIPQYRQHTYPDVMVIQGQPTYADASRTTVMNPIAIAEVLSQSTQNYDQGDKFRYYRSIPEMQEYILINQTQHHVMQYTKQETGQWLLTEYQGESAVLALGAIAFEIGLADLYDGVDFSAVDD
ncbi:Uma2 family endonuclease [Vacuolonema iberomarrocanum]|uniref:Uma2 family endonuclease n=1 Tax=Vacuolonema iberomarrocanum TaxID=3454632 RepID=UPI003F6E0844